MTNWEKNILDCLSDITGNGSFVSSHTTSFVFPGLEVERISELSYPISELQARTLIQSAQRLLLEKEAALLKMIRSGAHGK